MSIDNLFKFKDVLKKSAESNGYLYKINDKNYLNTAVVFYGGGLNSSDVEIESSDSSSSRTGSPSCCCQGSSLFLTSTVLSRISSGLPDKSASDTAIPGPNGGPCCRCTGISYAARQACPSPSSWMGFPISNRKVSRRCRSL